MLSLLQPRPDPYCGPAPGPEALLWAWNLDPILLLALALAGAAGWSLLHRQAAEPRRRRAFGLAMSAGVLAFVSPLCALTAALFAARGLHHLLLLVVLAPALAVAFPWRVRSLVPALGAASAALWAWHLPPIYALAWDHPAIYWGLQAALVLPAWAFWSLVLWPRQTLDDALTAALSVAGLAGQMGLIGAILTFAPVVMYPEHLALTEAYFLTPLGDQQLAGLVMWVPGMVPLAVAAGLILRAGWRREGARA